MKLNRVRGLKLGSVLVLDTLYLSFFLRASGIRTIHFLNPIFFQSQYSSPDEKTRSPTAKADKGFLASKGKVHMECTLDTETFYHGQELPIHVNINNNANKSVKSIRVAIGK